jgi:hypothetical protein
MRTLQYAVSDTLVLAKRSLLRIPRQPDLLVGFTIQPVLFVLLSSMSSEARSRRRASTTSTS